MLILRKMIMFCLALCLFISLTGQSSIPLKEDNLFVKGILKSRSKITSSPGGGASIKQLQEFDIVYIYEERDPNYYRVGPDITEAIGYLPKEDVQRWNSRISVHFTPMAGRDPALIFETSDQLIECLRGTTPFYTTDKKPNDNALAQEPDDDLSAHRFSMLLPVIKRKRESTGTGRHSLFNVGFLAGNKADIPVSRPKVRSSSKVAELELMFLIDATYSMTPFINATKDVIENVTRRIIRSREGGVRFGVTAYRDYVDNQSEMEFITRQYKDLTANSSAVIKTLDEVYQADIDSEDFPEAVFDGYYAAITETAWRESPNTLRVVILIGDASGHAPGSPKNPMNYSADLLLNKASEERIRTIAVKIITGREDDELSKSQFFELAEGATLADKGQYFEVEYPDDDVPDEFITKTSARIEAEISRLEKLIDVVEEAKKSGDVSMPSTLSATDRAILLKNIKLEFGSDKPIQFSTGWLSEMDTDGRKLVNTFAYMTKDEFDKMITYIKLMDQTINNPEFVVNGMVKEVLEAATGEELKGNDIEVHYEKTLGLPVKTDILKIPIEELSSWGADRKARMLELIKGKLLNLENWNNKLDNWYNAPGDSKMKYTFIPLDMLP